MRGSIIAAAILTLLPELLRGLSNYRMLIPMDSAAIRSSRIAMIARPVLELIRFRTMKSVIRININPIVNVLSFGVPLIPCGPFRRIFPSGSMFKDTESFIEKWNH